MGLVLDTAPAVEPVTVADLQTHLRITDTYFNDEMERLIAGARQSIEAILNRQLITATYLYSLDGWYFDCNGELRLPMPPLQTVTSIKYYDVSAVQQTWDASNYQVDTTGVVGTISLAYNVTTPMLQAGKKNAIVIEYDAGYGDAATDVPECIRQSILIKAGSLFEQRYLGKDKNDPDSQRAVNDLLAPEMVAEVY